MNLRQHTLMRRRAQRLKGGSGMTLIEMLITLSIMVFVAVAAFNTVNGGVKLWVRANSLESAEDAVAFVDAFAADLARVIGFSEIPFKGGESSVSFPAINDGDYTEPIGKRTYSGVAQPTRVEYGYDAATRSVKRRQSDYRALCEKEEARARQVLGNVHIFALSYMYLDEASGRLVPKLHIEDGAVPRFVRVEAVYGDKLSKRKKIDELIEIPAAPRGPRP